MNDIIVDKNMQEDAVRIVSANIINLTRDCRIDIDLARCDAEINVKGNTMSVVVKEK